MAGLLSARGPADFFDQVTLVDRDELGAAAGPRRGVPQGRHVHALLARGLQALETIFPGFTEELVSAGAPAGDNLAHTRLCFGGPPFLFHPWTCPRYSLC